MTRSAAISRATATIGSTPPPASGIDVGVLGDPGVAGGAEQLGRGGGASERADDRVLATAAADDEDPHRSDSPAVAQSDLAKSSLENAESVSFVVVPREPSSTDALAIVAASSASTTLMKS